MNFNHTKSSILKAITSLPLSFDSVHILSSIHGFPSIRCLHHNQNYYEVLELSKQCSSKDIRDAFITLSKKYHPDQNQDDPSNHTRFVLLNEAYSVLCKPESRRQYDIELKVKAGTYASPHYNQSRGAPFNYGDATQHEPFAEYYYRSRSQVVTEKVKISSRNFALFLVAFSLLGGIAQFYIIKLLYRSTYKEEMKRQEAANAAYIALRADVASRTDEENIRVVKERLNRQSSKSRGGQHVTNAHLLDA